MARKQKNLIASLTAARWRLLSLLGGAALLLLVKAGVDVLAPQAAEPPYLGAWLRVWVFAIFAIAAAVVWRAKDTELKLDVVAVLIGLCLAGIVLLGLKNTSYGLNGIGGDQGLQTAQVTAFASFPGAVDFAYKDLPPFYPPAYFLLLGKAAGLLGIEPYRMLKFGLIAVAFVLPVLVHFFWAWLRPRTLALAPIVSTVLYQDWYKPYEWLALVLFIPWWLHFVDGVGGEKNKRSFAWLVVGSLIGAVLFSTYYYWFFIGAIALAVRYLVRNTVAGDQVDKTWKVWRQRFLMLGGAAFLSFPYWWPLVFSMASAGSWNSLQNRYFMEEFNVLHLPFLEFSLLGFVSLAGLAYLLSSFQRNRLSFGLLVLVFAAYVWQLLGYVAFLADIPLLTFKARELVVYVLGLSAMLGVIDWLPVVWKSAARRRLHGPILAGALVVAVLFFGQALVAGFAEHPLLPPAREAAYPSKMLEDYKAIVGDGPKGRVLLADGAAAGLSIYLPVHQYLSWAAVFSHPAGQYYERVEFLQLLSKVESPGWFAAALMNNRYDSIDDIIMLPHDGYSFGYLPESFPYPSKTEHILFSAESFDPAYFSVEGAVDEFELIRPIYTANPLSDLPAPQAYDPTVPIEGIGDGDDLYAFIQYFGAHLDFPSIDEYRTLLAELYSD
jgi:galactan 5-O-arabinofuranosyltransferase